MTSIFGGTQSVNSNQTQSQNTLQNIDSAQQQNFQQAQASQTAPTNYWAQNMAPQIADVASSIYEQYRTPAYLNIAELTPDQWTAIGGLTESGMGLQPLIGQGAGYIGQGAGYMGQGAGYIGQGAELVGQSGTPITANDINAFYNPFASNVTANLQDIFGQQALANRVGSAGSIGGVGGDRAAVAQALLAKQQGLTAGQTYSDLYQRALAAAQQQKAQQLGAGQALSGAGGTLSGVGSTLSGIGSSAIQTGISGLGTALQAANIPYQQQQAVNQANYDYLMAQYKAPYERLSAMIQAVPGAVQAGGQTTGVTGEAAGQATTAGTQTSTGTGTGATTTTYPATSWLSQLTGLGSLGLGALSLFGSSDRRAKTDIQKLGKSKNGIPLYAFRYKGDPKTYPKVIGSMAQDVEKVYPEMVRRFQQGGGVFSAARRYDPYRALRVQEEKEQERRKGATIEANEKIQSNLGNPWAGMRQIGKSYGVFPRGTSSFDIGIPELSIAYQRGGVVDEATAVPAAESGADTMPTAASPGVVSWLSPERAAEATTISVPGGRGQSEQSFSSSPDSEQFYGYMSGAGFPIQVNTITGERRHFGTQIPVVGMESGNVLYDKDTNTYRDIETGAKTAPWEQKLGRNFQEGGAVDDEDAGNETEQISAEKRRKKYAQVNRFIQQGAKFAEPTNYPAPSSSSLNIKYPEFSPQAFFKMPAGYPSMQQGGAVRSKEGEGFAGLGQLLVDLARARNLYKNYGDEGGNNYVPSPPLPSPRPKEAPKKEVDERLNRWLDLFPGVARKPRSYQEGGSVELPLMGTPEAMQFLAERSPEPETTEEAESPPLPREQPPEAPSQSGGFGGRGANPAAIALMQAGLGMLAASGQRDARGLPLPPLAAIGKGGMAGLESYQDQQALAEKTALARQSMALRERAVRDLERHRRAIEGAKTSDNKPTVLETPLGRISVEKLPDGRYRNIVTGEIIGGDEAAPPAQPPQVKQEIGGFDVPKDEQGVAAAAISAEDKISTPINKDLSYLLKSMGTTPEQFDFNAKRLAFGDQSMTVGVRSKAGAMYVQALRARAAQYFIERGMTAQEANQAVAEFGAMKAGSRSLAQAEARVTTALVGAEAVAPIVLETSAKIPRTEVKSLNDLYLRAQEQFGSKDAVRYKTAIETLVTNYAAALGRGSSQLTDTMQKRAQGLLERGFTHGQVGAAVDQMLIEIDREKRGLARGMKTYLKRDETEYEPGSVLKGQTGTGGVPRQAPLPPKSGDIMDGYKFKGGDPSKQENWEPIT